jgi:uncharacterized membrane protein YfcA
VIPPTPTSRRASVAERPEMQATQPYRRASLPSSSETSTGTCASSARRTIGASVPSISQKTAARAGSVVSGRRASASAWVWGADTALVCPAMSARLPRLGAIATAAGVFSGLFGVGGGTVIVPLLVLWFGYSQREATGTSLAAIVVIGALGAAAQAVYGNVDVGRGLLIALPGMAGVLAGAAIQQRLSERAVAAAFIVLLLGSAAVLVF